MDEQGRHEIIWRGLSYLTRDHFSRKFAIEGENLSVEGPCLIVANHVTAWDPLILSVCLRDKQSYFVASEHIFRLGALTKLLNWLVAPIPRSKASSGADTVKACLRHLRSGHSVCLFAEGEQSWDGRPSPIFPATGKLARNSGASLVTFRLEGGYLSLPRWGKGVRRGKMRVRPVMIYSPETLKAMSPAEINRAIERDIGEDCWKRQASEPVAYRGKRPAEGLEKLLYLCPKCREIGRLRSRGDRLSCACGFSVRYTESGFFEPASPFSQLAQWNDWQQAQLRTKDFRHLKLLFSDDDLKLRLLPGSHREQMLERGRLTQGEDFLQLGERCFPMSEIRSMAMVQANRLLFSCGEDYYEIRAEGRANLKKYLDYRTVYEEIKETKR